MKRVSKNKLASSFDNNIQLFWSLAWRRDSISDIVFELMMIFKTRFSWQTSIAGQADDFHHYFNVHRPSQYLLAAFTFSWWFSHTWKNCCTASSPPPSLQIFICAKDKPCYLIAKKVRGNRIKLLCCINLILFQLANGHKIWLQQLMVAHSQLFEQFCLSFFESVRYVFPDVCSLFHNCRRVRD